MGREEAFELVDLAPAHYRGRKEPLPPVRGGKFVVLRHGGGRGEYLVLSPSSQSLYHAHVVERFCRLGRFSVPGRYPEGRRDLFLVEGGEWSVEGGGTWELDEGRRTLFLAGRSMSYGAVPLAPLVARLKALPALAGWDVRGC